MTLELWSILAVGIRIALFVKVRMCDNLNTMRPLSRYFPATARILMALIFVVTGLNGFLSFIPQPKAPIPEAATAFIGALLSTGYLFRLVMGTQLIVGILLLLNRFVPLALAVIAPIIVGIITFHIFLAPSGLPLAGVVLLLEIYLAWIYRKAFGPMLAMRTMPGQIERAGLPVDTACILP